MSDTLRNRIGKKVMVAAGNYPGTNPNETYTVATATSPKGSGAVFVQLTDSRGRTVKGWFQERDLLPARAPSQPKAEARIMKAATSLMDKTPGLSLADATKQAARLDLSSAKAWRDAVDKNALIVAAVDRAKANPGMTPEQAVTSVLNEERGRLAANKSLNALAQTYAAEQKVDLALAAKRVSQMFPDLAAAAR